MRYIALKRLKMGDGWREVGEDVPEAEYWRARTTYITRGLIAPVPDDPRQPAEIAVPHVTERGTPRVAKSQTPTPTPPSPPPPKVRVNVTERIGRPAEVEA